MCIRDRINAVRNGKEVTVVLELQARFDEENNLYWAERLKAVSYTHLRAHETVLDLVCRLLLEKKKQIIRRHSKQVTTMKTKLTHS